MAQQDAIEHLETFGYCLIEDAISADTSGRDGREVFPTSP